MTIRITAIRLSGGQGHEHISRLWWTNPADGSTSDNTRAEIVAWIEDKNGKAYVEDARSNRADVGVVTLTTGRSTCGPTPTASGPTTFWRCRRSS